MTSATSGVLCPANPPTYDSETGVYQYGDPAADYISPADLSFDFYPNFPNPSGIFPPPALVGQLMLNTLLSLRPSPSIYAMLYAAGSVAQAISTIWPGLGTCTRTSPAWASTRPRCTPSSDRACRRALSSAESARSLCSIPMLDP